MAQLVEDFKARRLHMTDLPGTISVKPVSGLRGIRVTLSGPQAQLDGIRRSADGDILTISGPAISGRGGMTMVVGKGGRQVNIVGGMSANVVSFGTGGVVISGATGPITINGKTINPGGGTEPVEELALQVEVPGGTPVSISDRAGGYYYIGDIDAPLHAEFHAHGQLQAGKVTDTNFTIQGSAEVAIDSITGQTARYVISGSGNVSIKKGKVTNLDATISGSGTVAFGGTATNANLNISGSGRMLVDTVTGQLNDHVSGSGRVDVRVRPARSADSFWA